MPKSDHITGIVEWDFGRYFPDKHWVSDWSEDEEYPDGYCYKLLTARDARTGKTEVVLVLTQADGTKEEMMRAKIASRDFDGFAKTVTDRLSEEFGLDFQERDYSRVRTLEEFIMLSKTFGWTWKKPKTKWCHKN